MTILQAPARLCNSVDRVDDYGSSGRGFESLQGHGVERFSTLARQPVMGGAVNPRRHRKKSEGPRDATCNSKVDFTSTRALALV